MRNVFPVKLHCSVAIFAAKFCCTFSQSIFNRHGHPSQPFHTIFAQIFPLDFTFIDFFISVHCGVQICFAI